MSIARDISRQTGRQSVTLSSTQSNITVTGGFSGSTLEVYLNGAKLLEGEDYTLNGTTGIILSQAGVAGDVIEFVSRVTSNVGLTAVGTANIIDESVTFGKLSNSATEADNVQKRTAKAWVKFDGQGAVPISDDLNVSTITDEGVGQYRVNFINTMANTNYCAIVSMYHQPSVTYSASPTVGVFTTTYVSVVTAGNTSNPFDTPIVCVVVFGEIS